MRTVVLDLSCYGKMFAILLYKLFGKRATRERKAAPKAGPLYGTIVRGAGTVTHCYGACNNDLIVLPRCKRQPRRQEWASWRRNMLCRTGPAVNTWLKMGGARQWQDWSRVSGPNLWVREAEWLTEPGHGSAHFLQRWSPFLGTQGCIFLQIWYRKADPFWGQIPDPKRGPQFTMQSYLK